jgi:hypothetical protein
MFSLSMKWRHDKINSIYILNLRFRSGAVSHKNNKQFRVQQSQSEPQLSAFDTRHCVNIAVTILPAVKTTKMCSLNHLRVTQFVMVSCYWASFQYCEQCCPLSCYIMASFRQKKLKTTNVTQDYRNCFEQEGRGLLQGIRLYIPRKIMKNLP